MKSFIAIATLLLLCSISIAQEATEIWKGTLDAKVAKLRLQLEIEPKGDEGDALGQLISLDQSNTKMKLDKLTREGDSISFSIRAMGVNYEGKVASDGKSIKGTFTQAGQSFPLDFVKGEKAKPTTQFQTWTGKMKAGTREFDFQFRVFQDEDQNITAKLDSFSERIFGLHCEITHDLEAGTVNIDIPITKATYVGKFGDDMKTINGKWKQAGGEFDLVLKQVDLDETREPKAPERPQTPKAPFPYKSKPITFKNEGVGIKLAGTLTVPKDSENPPVVILISGSGPQDRDETIADHRPFAVIADHLSRNGIAVFRYDERGVGASEGEFGSATSADLATDVEAAIDRLKGRRDVGSSKIILAGHSEGGLLAPMIASRRDDVDGIILLAAPAVNGAEIVLSQSRLIAATAGVSEEELDRQGTILKAAFELLKSKSDGSGDFYAKFKEKAASVMGKEIDGFELAPEIEMSVRQIDTPWFRYFATYEPGPALEKTQCPVLALIGRKDLQVDAKLNVPPLREALKAGGNKDVKIRELDNLNHLFQECKTGLPGEYGSIEQTFSPVALKLMSRWINERFAN